MSVFIATIIIDLLCVALSVFGYVEHSMQIDEIYAKNIDQEEYIQALKIDRTRTDAYFGILETAQSDGVIDEDDTVNYINFFVSYEDTSNNGEMVYPIYELAGSSLSDFINVCYQTGYSYWESYKTAASRANNAKYWFKRILPDDYTDIEYIDYKDGDTYSININGKQYSVSIGDDGNITYKQFEVALICSQISECKNSISTYSNSSSSINSISGEDNLKEAYISLWSNMQKLWNIAAGVDDQQLVIILCNEIFIELGEYEKELISYNSISESEMNDFISEIFDLINGINPNSDIISANRDNLLEKISDVKNTIEQYFDNLAGESYE